MGSLSDPAIAELVLQFRAQFTLTTCVETGTFLGRSAAWAAVHFDQVITMDIRADFQSRAIQHCQNFDNITFLLGDSRSLLPQVVNALTGPALFWLDAHAVTGMTCPCPILEELDAITGSTFDHFILIDNATLYQAPWWPTPEMLEAKVSERYIMRRLADVFIVTPRAAVDGAPIISTVPRSER
jgi:hypothetical protein